MGSNRRPYKVCARCVCCVLGVLRVLRVMMTEGEPRSTARAWLRRIGRRPRFSLKHPTNHTNDKQPGQAFLGNHGAKGSAGGAQVTLNTSGPDPLQANPLYYKGSEETDKFDKAGERI